MNSVNIAIPRELGERLRGAHAVTSELMSEVIGECMPAVSIHPTGREYGADQRPISSGAWTDAALPLLDFELPQWRVRRTAYDEAEWYCALSRERELPDWLDRSIEASHADSRWRSSARSSRLNASAYLPQPSVPTVPRAIIPLYEPVCCDNFS